MEIETKKWYFGTDGSTGHYFKKISGPDMSPEFVESFERSIDSDQWMRRAFSMYNMIYFDDRAYYWFKARVNGALFTVLAVPWSVDDHRGRSHTEFFMEGEHSFSDMIEYVLNHPFLRKQFMLCKK